MLMYPKCRQEVELTFLLGTFLELVDKEVLRKQKELLVNTLRPLLMAFFFFSFFLSPPVTFLPKGVGLWS